jgi:hypothetical protein
MGTTKKTTGSNESSLQFNPMAQAQYNNLVQSGGNQLQGMINNPFGNALYSMGLGQSQKGAQQQGQNNMGVLTQNQKAQGLNGQGGAGFMAAQRAMTGRANAGMMSNANTSNVMAALQRQMMATGMGMSFNPQLTGQKGNSTQTEQTSGAGTWAPQLAGAAISAGLGAMTGGASLGIQAAMKGARGAMGGMAGGGQTFASGLSPGFAQSMSGMGFNTMPMTPNMNPFMNYGGGN